MIQLLTTRIHGFGTGYIPEPPNPRDRTAEHPDIKPLLAKRKAAVGKGSKARSAESPPAKVDLRAYFPPVFNQESANSCTAQAAAAILMYYEQRAFGEVTQPSRFFIYKVARNLVGQSADLGAFIRTTFEALETIGAPPEQFWSYLLPNVNVEPSAFVYSLAGRYRVLRAFRHDPPGAAKEEVLRSVKASLALGIPAAFGFLVYSSIQQAAQSGRIPLPVAADQLAGGHAVTAVGYDDELKIKNAGATEETVGAFLIRNSWDTGWGESGYGWIPYDYLLQDLATDWWSVLSEEYLELDRFGAPPAPGTSTGGNASA